MFKQIYDNMQNQTPIIHTITNYVTVNDCANVILATGGSPIMADEIDEIEDVLKFSSALVINVGTLNKRVVESMVLAGKVANRLNIPVILDPVGVGATNFRNDVVKKLLNEIKFDVIKGNVSELKFLTSNIVSSSGVDVAEKDVIDENNIEGNIKLFNKLAIDTGAVIVATGVIDIVTSKEKTYVIKNGSSFMSRITGAGCMLGCVLACYVATNKENIAEAVAFGVSSYGVSGEKAEKLCKGNSSFKMELIDYISNSKYQELKEGMKIEFK